jgi:hypothetical protein
MKSERQKREEEIERLLRGDGLSPEQDLGFQEKVRKAASAIIQDDAARTEKSERAKRHKSSVSPQTAGLSLVVLGAAVSFSMPLLAAALIVAGIAAIVWAVQKRSAK